MERKGLRYELRGVPDGREIGGEHFDDFIYKDFLEHCPPDIKEYLSSSQNRADRLRVRNMCRAIKHDLSIANTVRKNIIINGQPVKYSLSRQQFKSMIEDSVEETITCCENLLSKACVKSGSVRCVLIVGGSCRIPYIREQLTHRLQIEVSMIDEPELAVSMGAAYYGDALDRAVEFVNEVDALCTSIQFHEALNGHLSKLFRSLAQSLAHSIANEAVAPALRSWQHGLTTTLNRIQPDIERRTRNWINGKDCQKEIRKSSLAWVKARIPELTALSDPICDSYRVSRNILHLPKHIPQLEAGLPSAPVHGGGIDTDNISDWISVIVGIVVGIIIAHLHFLAALAGPVGFIIGVIAIIYSKDKAEEVIREANLPKFLRSLALSDEKITIQVRKVQTTLENSIMSELEKNRADFDQFIHEITSILKDTMHEQAVREARFIWLHTEEEQEQIA